MDPTHFSAGFDEGLKLTGVLLLCLVLPVIIVAWFGLPWNEPPMSRTSTTQLSRPRPTPIATAPWQKIAARKGQVELDKIPKKWLLCPDCLSRAKTQTDTTGSFIESLLGHKSRSITSLSVPDLMAKTKDGSLSAVELVTAFCERAAYGHQLVCQDYLPRPLAYSLADSSNLSRTVT